MEEWRFFGERTEDGITYQLGKYHLDAMLYRWEPLAVPLPGSENGEFRRTLTERSRILSACKSHGLLRVEGPVYYQNRLWVGWENQQGAPALGANHCTELKSTVQALLSLIRAYEIAHLAGLVIGPPDFRRITRTATGFQMPDPWIKDYLARPLGNATLPEGLEQIFPPEVLKGAVPDLQADRFYLGLLLYLLISGKIPYVIKKGWPQGVAAGKTIPLIYHQPKLNAELSYLVEDLLTVNPEERPSAREVRLKWQEIIREEAQLATSRDYLLNLQKSHRYFNGLRVFNLFNRLKIPLGLIAVVTLMTTGFWRLHHRPALPAEQFIQRIFQAPASVSPFLNATGASPLLLKLTDEQNKRRQLMAELNSRPYVELQSIKLVSRTKKEATLQLGLKWWTWEHGRWQPVCNQERVILKRYRNTWKLVKTYPWGHPLKP